MKLKFLLIATMTLVASTVFAQESGLKGRVLSRDGRAAVGNVAVTIEGTTYKARTNDNGFFELKGVPAGDYKLSFTAPEFENLDIVVKVENGVKDINAVIVVPKALSSEVIDDAIFAEFDTESSSSDTPALPSMLSASKDLYNNIASYRFSEMRFNVRGYDSKYTDVYLNGIRYTCHFEVSEWDDSKYITLALCNNSVRVGFEFDSKGNLLFIS